MAGGYQPKSIEKKWQERWEADGAFHALTEDDHPKKYVLDMFPDLTGSYDAAYVNAIVFNLFNMAIAFSLLRRANRPSVTAGLSAVTA